MRFFKTISAGKQSDEELVHRFRRNADKDVLAELYSRYMEMVYSVCLKYLADPEPARDAVMEIYQELLDKMGRHDVANFRSWLYTVTKNHCLMKIRGMRHRTVNIDDNFMQSGDVMHHEDVHAREAKFVLLDECLEKLPVEQRRVIDLFYLQQHCYNAITEITGFDWNKVRSLVQNGRRNLKLCMEKTLNPRAHADNS